MLNSVSCPASATMRNLSLLARTRPALQVWTQRSPGQQQQPGRAHGGAHGGAASWCGHDTLAVELAVELAVDMIEQVDKLGCQ